MKQIFFLIRKLEIFTQTKNYSKIPLLRDCNCEFIVMDPSRPFLIFVYVYKYTHTDIYICF